MSVMECVVKTIVDSYPFVKNHKIERACKEHQLSGLREFRRLKQYGIIDYEFNKSSNSYRIITPIGTIKKKIATKKRSELLGE